jgi:hypothetical protein
MLALFYDLFSRPNPDLLFRRSALRIRAPSCKSFGSYWGGKPPVKGDIKALCALVNLIIFEFI